MSEPIGGKRPVWLRFLKALVSDIGRNQINFLAASIAFYAWLALFPVMLLLSAGLGMYLTSDAAQAQALELLAELFPALKASGPELEQLLFSLERNRGTAGLIGLGTLIWVGLQVVIAFEIALNRVFQVEAPPRWLRQRMRASLVMLVGATVAMASMLVSFLLGLFATGWLERMGGHLASLLLTVWFFAVVYRALPRLTVPWRSALVGGLVTSLLWFIANRGLQFYFANFTSYDKIYGSFAGVVIVLFACYWAAFAALIGAEVTRMLMRFNFLPKLRQKT